jgi:hypothetical protein
LQLTGTNRPRICHKNATRPLCGSRGTVPVCLFDSRWNRYLHRVSATIARGKRPVPSRTRKLSLSAPMVLRGPLRGRVGRRRTHFRPRSLGSPGGLGCFLLVVTELMARKSGWKWLIIQRVGPAHQRPVTIEGAQSSGAPVTQAAPQAAPDPGVELGPPPVIPVPDAVDRLGGDATPVPSAVPAVVIQTSAVTSVRPANPARVQAILPGVADVPPVVSRVPVRPGPATGGSQTKARREPLANGPIGRPRPASAAAAIAQLLTARAPDRVAPTGTDGVPRAVLAGDPTARRTLVGRTLVDRAAVAAARAGKAVGSSRPMTGQVAAGLGRHPARPAAMVGRSAVMRLAGIVLAVTAPAATPLAGIVLAMVGRSAVMRLAGIVLAVRAPAVMRLAGTVLALTARAVATSGRLKTVDARIMVPVTTALGALVPVATGHGQAPVAAIVPALTDRKRVGRAVTAATGRAIRAARNVPSARAATTAHSARAVPGTLPHGAAARRITAPSVPPVVATSRRTMRQPADRGRAGAPNWPFHPTPILGCWTRRCDPSCVH